MPQQPALTVMRYEMKNKTTRHEKFLAEMDQAVPCGRLLVLILPQ